MIVLQPALIEQDQVQHCQKQTPVCVSPRKHSCWVLAPTQPQADGLRVSTSCTGEWDKLLLLGAPTWLQHLCPPLVSSPHLTAAGQQHLWLLQKCRSYPRGVCPGLSRHVDADTSSRVAACSGEAGGCHGVGYRAGAGVLASSNLAPQHVPGP